MTSRDIYLFEVLCQTPRLLGLINRNPLSATYGCFDRQYWHYNTTDFPCAEYQESILTLAYLYNLNHINNPFYNKAFIIELINAGITFWCKIQNKNGSFSEWYPHENSMSVTPFSTYAISEVLLQLKNKITCSDLAVSCLEKAGNWLARNKDMRATNHYSGSIAALHNLFIITGSSYYKTTIDKIISELIQLQDDEGWFPEYNGADIGYTSVTLYYIARYFKMAKDSQVLKMISSALDFIFYFIHPDGTFGGEYGSRNTEYLIPDAFEILAPHFPKAAIIASHLRQSIKDKKHVIPSFFDDRYLSYLSYMYLQAYLDASNVDTDGNALYNQSFVKEFSNSGLKIVSTDWCYCVQNIKKGGAYKIDFKGNKNSFVDSGILVQDRNKKNFYSFYLDSYVFFKSEKHSLKITRNLTPIPSTTLSPFFFVLQRLFNLSIGKIEWIEKRFKDTLRDLLITKIKPAPYRFTREIVFFKDSFSITDSITEIDSISLILVGVKSSYVYGPSTRFFQPSELNQEMHYLDDKILSKYSGRNEIFITRNYENNGNLVSMDFRAE